MRFFLSFVFLLLIGLLFPFRSFASNNFSVSEDSIYTIKDSGITHVSFKIVLTNNSPSYFASVYTQKLGFQDMQNIRASDFYGSITPVVKKGSNTTDVELPLNGKTVGKDNKVFISFSFDTKDVSSHLGYVWEISIPRLVSSNNFSNYSVEVQVPSSFGEPVYIKPTSYLKKSSSVLFFKNEDLHNSGISIGYGQRQLFSFTTKYQLKNSNFFPLKTTIALPMSTNYQDVYYTALDPKPNQVIKDEDGNWIAEYTLSPTESKTVVARGLVEMLLYPKRERLSQAQRKKYTQPARYWESDNPKIKELARTLQTPEQIFEYVTHYLRYDLSRVSANMPRLGSLQVLQNPKSAVCLEFTDLFIALARANGIPAREVDGFAYTKNSTERPLSYTQDILHAWPEYYDFELEAWVMVDPTWATTTGGIDYFNTLDFNHIAFVIRGLTSEYPIPAGGYKIKTDDGKKDVAVSFSNDNPVAILDLVMDIQIPQKQMAGFTPTGLILVKNTGNTLLPEQKIEINSQNLEPRHQTVSIPAIPPYGYIQVPVSFTKTLFLTKLQDTLTISIGNKTVRHKLDIEPIVLSQKILIYGGILGVLFSITIFAVAVKAGRLRIFG